ncbi:MAG: FeoA domain-containing protein [Gemmatimonadota bacterium]
MTPSRSRGSLAAIRPGVRAQIRAILFHGVRATCQAAGLREGDVVRCRESGPSGITLDVENGPTTSLSRQVARFVEVDLLGKQKPAAHREISSRLPDPALDGPTAA